MIISTVLVEHGAHDLLVLQEWEADVAVQDSQRTCKATHVQFLQSVFNRHTILVEVVGV